MRDLRSRNGVLGSSDPVEPIRFWRRFTVLWFVVLILSLGASFFLVPGVQSTLWSGKASGLLASAVLVVGALTLLVAGLYGLGAPERRIPEDKGKPRSVQPPGTNRSGSIPKAA
jgi:hypothetical protein